MERRIGNLRANIMDLPEKITEEILLLLSVKDIVMCKNSCKTWHRIISSTHFMELHYTRSKSCIVLYNQFHSHPSRTCYLFEPSELYRSCCSCDVIESAQPVKMKLDIKLKIPLRNDEMMTNSNANAEASAGCGKNTKKRKLTLKPEDDLMYLGYDVVNSCNGILCLRDDMKIIVCNPITNEYIKLPDNIMRLSYVHSGLGFCQDTKQYKVLKVGRTDSYTVAEIITLGSNSWRSIHLPNISLTKISPTYLNGVLYFVGAENERHCIISFEYSCEGFKLLTQLPFECRVHCTYMGMIGDSLCLWQSSNDLIDIWLMKNNGIQKSWSKLMSISFNASWAVTEYEMVSCSKCEAFILFACFENIIFIYGPRSDGWRKIRIQKSRFKAKLIPHTPSFFSLKDIVPGVDIMSISTCFKLPGETRAPYLREDFP